MRLARDTGSPFRRRPRARRATGQSWRPDQPETGYARLRLAARSGTLATCGDVHTSPHPGRSLSQAQRRVLASQPGAGDSVKPLLQKLGDGIWVADAQRTILGSHTPIRMTLVDVAGSGFVHSPI